MLSTPRLSQPTLKNQSKSRIDAQTRRGILNITYPIEHGVVKDWDGMEAMWSHLLCSELRIGAPSEPLDRAVLLTEAPLTPKPNRAKMAQVMFEKLGVPALHVRSAPLLALYAAGRASGLMVDSGDGVTHTVPIYERYVLPHAIRRWDFGGRDVTEWLGRLLRVERGYVFGTSAEKEVVRVVKEMRGYVALDYEKEMGDVKERVEGVIERKYELPDGHSIVIGSEM